MRFSAISAVFGLVASVLAQDPNFDPIFAPGAYEEVPVGQPFTITWSAQPADVLDVTVSITLIGGAEQNTQVPLYTIATGIVNNAESFTWTPDVNEYGKNFYGLIIRSESNTDQFQYSNPFKLVAGAASTPTDAATTGVPTATKTVSLSPVVETTSSAVVVTPPAASADTLPHTSAHNNGTAVLTRPATTLTPVPTFAQPTTFESAPTASVSVTPTPLPGGAVAQGVSLALVGAGALFALAF